MPDDRPLHEADLDADPYVQFRAWYDDAVACGEPQPEAMCVATAGADGRPSARMVLLRGVDARGFTFFTNYGSRKGRDLAANPFASLVWHWPLALRQVRAFGPVEHVAAAESDEYWCSRPRGSRVSAWASEQSERVGDRAELEARAEEAERRFADDDVPRPEWWGGYRVHPEEVEFWQHREDRLHDRLRYRARAAGSWRVERLQP